MVGAASGERVQRAARGRARAHARLQSELRVGGEARHVEHVGGRGHLGGADLGVALPQSEHAAQKALVRAGRQPARAQEVTEGDQAGVGRNEQLRLRLLRLPPLLAQPRRLAGGGGRGARGGARVRHCRRLARAPIASAQACSADAAQRAARALGEGGEQAHDVLQRGLGHLGEQRRASRVSVSLRLRLLVAPLGAALQEVEEKPPGSWGVELPHGVERELVEKLRIGARDLSEERLREKEKRKKKKL